MSLTPGTRLGSYEVISLIGTGGMGEVYRARDTKLDRDVAIKVLPEAFADDPERLDRFEREAHLLAQLNHANIATLHGLEEHEGQQFLVMELVEGETLAERITRGPLPVDEAIPLFIQIAEGLEAAHAKGILHRDLKPANIKIGSDGKPKILDFGLAKTLGGIDEATPAASQSPTLTRGTALGAIVGTASYMSPEQARGHEVDKKTDVWAFGCCLYEALAGQRAFQGQTVSDIIGSILRDEPSTDALPPQMARVVRRCLRADPRSRLHDIADARVELEESRDEPPASRGASSGGRPSWAVAALAGVLGGAVTASWLVLTRPAPVRPDVTRLSIELPAAEEIELGGQRHPVAISRDGRHVAYATKNALYLRAIDAFESTRLVNAVATHPVFSPDGEWLAFRGAGLFKVPLRGGEPLRVAELPTHGAAWADETTLLAGAFELALVDETEEHRVVATVDPDRTDKLFKYPQILPGGEWALVTAALNHIESYDDAVIEVVSLTNGSRKVVLSGGSYARYVASGHLVYGRGGSLWATRFDLDRLEVIGRPTPVLDGVLTDPHFGPAYFDVADDGTLVYIPGEPLIQRRKVVWVSRDGHEEPSSIEARAFVGLCLLPDGRAAFLVAAANDQIWVGDVERGTLSRLSLMPGNHGAPTCSPDGSSIAWSGFRGGEDNNLYVRPADGSAAATTLLDGLFAVPLSWSPDGTRLLLEVAGPETNGEDLWTIDLDGGENDVQPFLSAEGNQDFGAFSPDGRLVAYTSDENGRRDVYVVRASDAGGRVQISTGGGERPRWNPAGGEIFYRLGRSVIAVPVRSDPVLAAGTPRTLFEGDYIPSYDVAANGERFLMVRRDSEREPVTTLRVVRNWFVELERLAPTEN